MIACRKVRTFRGFEEFWDRLNHKEWGQHGRGEMAAASKTGVARTAETLLRHRSELLVREHLRTEQEVSHASRAPSDTSQQ